MSDARLARQCAFVREVTSHAYLLGLTREQFIKLIGIAWDLLDRELDMHDDPPSVDAGLPDRLRGR